MVSFPVAISAQTFAVHLLWPLHHLACSVRDGRAHPHDLDLPVLWPVDHLAGGVRTIEADPGRKRGPFGAERS